MATLTIRDIRARPVMVPFKRPPVSASGALPRAALVLIDLETEEGITGRSYLWCYFPAAMAAVGKILDEVASTVQGELLAPADLWSAGPS